MNNGGPAFPTENEHQSGNNTYHFSGLTKLEWFAGMAMTGMFASDTQQWCIQESRESYALRAEIAYLMAEAMLAESERRNAKG